MLFGKLLICLCTLQMVAVGILTRADYFYRKDRPFLLAHRGMFGDYPEHTLPGFTEAYYVGADWLEIDIHLTKDGVPVIAHDMMLDKSTNILDERVNGPY